MNQFFQQYKPKAERVKHNENVLLQASREQRPVRLHFHDGTSAQAEVRRVEHGVFTCRECGEEKEKIFAIGAPGLVVGFA